MSNLSSSKANLDRYLVFTLNKEHFILPILHVKEVMGYLPPTFAPGVPSYFKGIMNLRGNVITVIDIKEKLKYQGSDTYGPDATIIILDLKQHRVAIIVDSVDKVISIDAANITPPSEIEASFAIKYITGAAKIDEDLILALDIEMALSHEDYDALSDDQQIGECA